MICERCQHECYERLHVHITPNTIIKVCIGCATRFYRNKLGFYWKSHLIQEHGVQ